jgi:uncharacterized protein YkwD
MARLNLPGLALFCLLFILCLGSRSSTHHPADNPGCQADSALFRLEVRAFHLVNQYRQSRGCMKLELSDAITDVARTRSRWMADHKTMNHDGFEGAAMKLNEVTPYKSVAENLGTNFGYQDAAEAALEGWITSDPHRHSMLGNFDLTGVGVARDSLGAFYFTQLFIRSR